MAPDEDSFDDFLDTVDDTSKTVDAPKKKQKKPFKLFGGMKLAKEKKKKAESTSSFYDEALDFSVSDDDDFYGVSASEQTNQNERQDTKLTLQTLFEFRWWELAILVVEVLLVVYLVLVLTKVLPLF